MRHVVRVGQDHEHDVRLTPAEQIEGSLRRSLGRIGDIAPQPLKWWNGVPKALELQTRWPPCGTRCVRVVEHMTPVAAAAENSPGQQDRGSVIAHERGLDAGPVTS